MTAPREAATASATTFLFAYGTLMFPAIFRRVTGLDGTMRPATLCGFARRRVRGHPFPGLEPARGGHVDGVLVGIESAAVWQRLDEFESDFYARIEVTTRDSTGLPVAAETYVVTPSNRRYLEAREWDPQAFRARDMQAYLADDA